MDQTKYSKEKMKLRALELEISELIDKMLAEKDTIKQDKLNDRINTLGKYELELHSKYLRKGIKSWLNLI